MGAQTTICTLSSLLKTDQWPGYSEKIGHYQIHMSEMDQSVVVSRYILPKDPFYMERTGAVCVSNFCLLK